MLDTLQAPRAAEQGQGAAEMTMEALGHAVEYLLVSNLNLINLDVAGPAGNTRLIKLFFALLQSIGAPAVFCDVGAHDGSTAVAVKQLFPATRVLSLEANPHIHRMHEQRLQQRGIESLNLAATSSHVPGGTTTIFVPRTLSRAYVNGAVVPAAIAETANTGKSSLLKRDEDATYDEVSVPSTSLDLLLGDNLAAQGTRRCALWIDVEGAAFEVLLGAERTLEHTSAIFIEGENFPFWQNQKMSGDIARVLIAKGFLPVSRDREYSDKQFNTIFIHSSYLHLLLPPLYGLRRGPAAPPPALPDTPFPASQLGRRRSYASLPASLAADIPIYVPTFNNPSFARQMVDQLQAWNLRNIVFIDNGSSFGPMLALLDQLERDVKVIRLTENYGPHHLVQVPGNLACLPEVFCLTDPDLLFDKEMPQDFLLTLLRATNHFEVGKAGLALDIHDQARLNPDKFSIHGGAYTIWEWESRFWQSEVGKTEDGATIFKADIDTTFALYNKKYFKLESFHSAVRVAGKYTCKHLPWYRDLQLPVDEERFYKSTQKFSFHLR